VSKWKGLAIFFSLISFGAIKETHRIFTSEASDIAQNRNELMWMSAIISLVILILTVWFWKKASEKRVS
jgi:hypothetical protein